MKDYDKVVDSLEPEALRQIVLRQLHAGYLNEETLKPVKIASHHLGKHGAFHLPEGCFNPEFLAEGGFGTVARAQMRKKDASSGSGYTTSTVAVKRVKIPNNKDDWEDTLRLLRELHFLKHMPHENLAPALQIYPNAGTGPV